MDTIAAIATPPGSGGISIIRISGNIAFEIADKIFISAISVHMMESHSIRYGKIKDIETGEIIDECMLTKMSAPSSYTREDVVEVNCHGSYIAVRKILEQIFKCGARPAEPGEFTKRAFLNGRIDLSEAEAVMDIINSRTEESLRASVDQLEGRLSSELNKIRKTLIDILSEIEVTMDYPEYDMEEDTGTNVIQNLNLAIDELRKLSRTFDRGRIIKEGVRTVIAGKPNAGKSSLMNYMVGKDRAIVTDVPGTTRDTIEELVEIDGIPLLLVDTAGLRETDDSVEQIGVFRAKEEIVKADLVLYMIDLAEFSGVGAELFSEIPEEKSIIVLNKTDLVESADIIQFKGYFCVKTSVLTGEGLEQLMTEIKKRFELGEMLNTQNLITNIRHKILVDDAINSLERAKAAFAVQIPLDCLSLDIWAGAKKIGEITGESVSDQVIENIFARFCVGK
jgi:tRNA modification GTPase